MITVGCCACHEGERLPLGFQKSKDFIITKRNLLGLLEYCKNVPIKIILLNQTGCPHWFLISGLHLFSSVVAPNIPPPPPPVSPPDGRSEVIFSTKRTPPPLVIRHKRTYSEPSPQVPHSPYGDSCPPNSGMDTSSLS